MIKNDTFAEKQAQAALFSICLRILKYIFGIKIYKQNFRLFGLTSFKEHSYTVYVLGVPENLNFLYFFKLRIFCFIHFLSKVIIPPASEAKMEVSNLTERKNPQTPIYGVEEFVCLSEVLLFPTKCHEQLGLLLNITG